MDQCLNRPTLTEGESSDKTKMRVGKLRDLEQIYKCTPKCTIKEVERMSQETHHTPAETDLQKKKSNHEDPSGKCKGYKDKSLSRDNKVSKPQNSSQSCKLRASETGKSEKDNNVRAAPKRTSTYKEYPGSFPRQKQQMRPTTRKKYHSLKATTKEVKTDNLTQNDIKENEEGCFRRLIRKSGSSKEIKPSEKAGVEGSNESSFDLHDSDDLLIDNVQVTGGTCMKRARNLVFETSSDDEKAQDSGEKNKKSYRASDDIARVTENELNGRQKGSSRIFLRDHMNEEHISPHRRDEKFSSRSSKKWRSVWKKSAKSVIAPALSGNHEANEHSHVDATGNNGEKLSEQASLKEYRFSSCRVGHKNSQKNVSSTQVIACKEADNDQTLRCLEGDEQSTKVEGKEKVSSRDERVTGKLNKTRLRKEEALRYADNRVPRRATDDHNPRFSPVVSHKRKVLDELQSIVGRDQMEPTSDTNKSFSESTTPEGTEFETNNWKPSPPFVISQKTNPGSSRTIWQIPGKTSLMGSRSQKTNPGSSRTIWQIPGKTSLMGSRIDVSRGYGHLLWDGSYSPLSAISMNSTSGEMFNNFELQKTDGASQVLGRKITGSKDKMRLSMMAKNSIHDISQAKSQAAESTGTGRLRLLGIDIDLDADETRKPAETSRSTGSHKITMGNIVGPKSSDGIVSPMINMARPAQSLSIGPRSRLNDSRVSPLMVHNNLGTQYSSHRPTLQETAFMNNGQSASGHLPPEIAATYMNSFSQPAAPLVPDNNFWGHANPSYFQYQARQQSMAASRLTPYAPPNCQATRNKADPKPLSSGVPASSFAFSAARGPLMPTSSSASSASKPALRRSNHPSLF